METKIPKIIHYCWFGGNPLPQSAQRCLENWKKFCPDYQIVEWNESNFDVNAYLYTKEAYEQKKWAFVSDVARLYALIECGGIYMDTDVEILKSLEDLLDNDGFLGFEGDHYISTGIMASKKDNPVFKELLDDYKTRKFVKENGELDVKTNVETITEKFVSYGVEFNNQKQECRGFIIYPNDYFCPKDPGTRKLSITKNSYTIHHFDGSWLSAEEQCYIKLLGKYRKIFPKKLAGHFAKFGAIKKTKGLKYAVKESLAWMRKK